MKKLDLERYAPLGIDIKRECRWILTGLIASAVFSLGFVFRYSSANDSLYQYVRVGGEMKKVLLEGAVIQDFVDILGSGLMGFAAVAVCMLVLLAGHYSYHFWGAKSIYLMRRLPRRELLRRCAALPLTGMAACLLAAAVFLLIYFSMYQLITPKQCLPGHQWQILWNTWMGVSP